MTAPTCEFFWDVASPYTYLAFTQLEKLRAASGAEIVLRPFLLGGVFKASGNVMPAENPAKAQYIVQDLKRWRAHYAVPMRLPVLETPFPINSVLPMRAAIAAAHERAAEPFAAALFDAYWVRGVDVSTSEAVAEAASSVGLEPDGILAAASAQAVKDELRHNSDDAVRRGAFGAPAFFVGDELFWGNDRIPLLIERLKAGARP
jgi:2-hydroxychromene-2-carboxylate isomerase